MRFHENSEVHSSQTLQPEFPAGERRRGRPAKGESEKLARTILETAFNRFIESGYQATSMDAIAAEAGSSKRTLYDRFPSKAILFEAAIQQQVAIDHEEFSRFETHPGPIDATLYDMAIWLRRNTMNARFISLHRLLAAEAHRHDDLSRYADETVMKPVLVTLCRVFEQAIARKQVVDLPPAFLAEQFLQAVCGRDARRRVYGRVGNEGEATERERVENALRLFLDGSRRG